MRIPYIKSIINNETVECNADVVITHNNSPVLISLIDNHNSVNEITKNISEENVNMSLYDHSDQYFTQFFYTSQDDFKFKSSKLDSELSHTIIYNDKIDDYVIDWGNNGLTSVLTNYLQEKKFLPVNEHVVNQVLKGVGRSRIVSECEVFSLQDTPINAWRFNNIDLFHSLLRGVTIPKSNADWDNINSIQDYLYNYADSVTDKIHEKVNIMYREEKVPANINDNITLYDGQIPLVTGGLEVLRRKNEKFVYLSAGMGTGKTVMSIKMNDLYHNSVGRPFYSTLIIAPNITLQQWKKEIYTTKDIADVIIVKNTNEFIRLYNETGLKFKKPTYILTGKETFKLSYQKEHGVIPTRTYVNYNGIDSYGNKENIRGIKDVCLCPDCYEPLVNQARKQTVFFKEEDFNKPRKNNYKCPNCDAVLFQSVYNKSRKTSIIDFVKRKNIHFDSVIIDEAHEGNNFDSIIGMATRDIMRRSKKVILLSGTVTNGYASSIFNILYSLVPNKLKLDDVFDMTKFIEEYGTLENTARNKDENKLQENHRITRSGYKEVEGINPMVFTKYMSGNFIFAELEDMRKDLPKLNDISVEVDLDTEISKSEDRLRETIKKHNPFNAGFYDNTVIKHYTNNPFHWNNITIKDRDENEIEIKTKNHDIELLNKEIELIKIIKKEKSKNRKTWVYTDFVSNGKYTTGESMQDRLARILKENGISVFVLKSSTRAVDRDKIINKNKDKYDVFMSHPKLIEVGINLQWCTNYVFYTPSYHVNTVRQASRRGLRINSTEDNNIYHLSYKQGVESKIWERYKLKRAESDSIENKFNDIQVNRTASNLSSSIQKQLHSMN